MRISNILIIHSPIYFLAPASSGTPEVSLTTLHGSWTGCGLFSSYCRDRKIPGDGPAWVCWSQYQLSLSLSLNCFCSRSGTRRTLESWTGFLPQLPLCSPVPTAAQPLEDRTQCSWILAKWARPFSDQANLRLPKRGSPWPRKEARPQSPTDPFFPHPIFKLLTPSIEHGPHDGGKP